MIGSLFEQLRGSRPESGIAIESGATRLTLSQLQSRAESIAKDLQQLGAKRVAIYADNGIDWIVADLACQAAGLIAVPLPLFFSAAQLGHILDASSIDTIISDRDVGTVISNALPASAQVDRIFQLRPATINALPPGTQKITFTSGTTGTPKGVCLSSEQQLTLAASLVSAIGLEAPKHLCVLPLSTLLENLAGMYAPLLSGGTIVVPTLAEVGLAGSSGLDVDRWLGCIERHQPNSLIIVPEMLRALTLATEAGWSAPSALQFVAVGGGKVAPDLLRRARAAGIPAYEGYGLSECSSVVCLNVPGSDRIGSVGLPLRHVVVTTENDEIVVRGSTFLGYVNQPDTWNSDTVHTGDVGHMDDDGFFHVSGRRKHQLITSFGRNLSPEWVESELNAGPILSQAMIVGDDRPWCVALLCARDPSCGDADIANWVDSVNLRLPDYARIGDWYRLPRALSERDGLLTENGRLKRAEIEQTYQHVIDDMYNIHQEVSGL